MSKETKNERNYWPYAIVGMILTVVVLGIWTIKVAVSNPVQLDRSFMRSYQEVDENYNEIVAAQKAFEKKYRVDLSSNRLKIGENRIEVAVTDKEGHAVSDANITAIVSRPTTHVGEKRLTHFHFTNGRYVSEPFKIEKEGRWNIDVKVTVAKDTGYKTYKTFVRR